MVETRTRSAPQDDAVVGAALMAGAANVIMQLSLPAVGYGVVESKVDSGNTFLHPVKRTRTTLTYLAVATLGSDEEKRRYRHAVNGQHKYVRSTETSPVKYNAFDPELQLWVAACLYKGVEDTWRIFRGEPDPATIEAVYQNSASLGTTLQVPRDMWPADRAAFEEYWKGAVEKIALDDTVRGYLHDLIMLRFLPRGLSVLFGPFHRFVTTGFLPPRFRDEMRLAWWPGRQRRFDRLMSLVAVLVRYSPRVVRQFPFNALLWDLRRRIHKGRSLV